MVCAPVAAHKFGLDALKRACRSPSLVLVTCQPRGRAVSGALEVRYLVRICLLWACDVGEEGITPSGGARACVVETGEYEDVQHTCGRVIVMVRSPVREQIVRGVGGEDEV